MLKQGAKGFMYGTYTEKHLAQRGGTILVGESTSFTSDKSGAIPPPPSASGETLVAGEWVSCN
jgi:hypothetical protein